MTMFICYGNTKKAKEEFLAHNSVPFSNDFVTNPQTKNQCGTVQEEEKELSSKAFWIRLTWIYLIVMSLTIGVIGTVAYKYRLTKTPSLNTACSCTTDTKRLFLRMEELERKINSFENYFPITSEDDIKVGCRYMYINLIVSIINNVIQMIQ